VLELDNDQIVEKIMVPLAFSYDHRVINGVDAGEFMQEIKTLMEDYHND
jgi:pyruvate/2-oxoglutarate dehydrogenase complex dihydrolipoamide acyltransferase (E2) component